MRAGYELNVPPVTIIATHHGGSLGKEHSFISVDAPNVIVDTVKRSEDGDEVVVRVYEAHGARGPVILSFDGPIVSATETNLMEEDSKEIAFEQSNIRFDIRPFEVRTLRIGLCVCD